MNFDNLRDAINKLVLHKAKILQKYKRFTDSPENLDNTNINRILHYRKFVKEFKAEEQYQQIANILSRAVSSSGRLYLGTERIHNSQKISLRGQSLNAQQCEVLAMALGHNPENLRELSLSRNLTIGDEGIEYLMSALKSNTHLKILHLQNCSISDNGAECIGLYLATNGSLIELDLEYNHNITVEGWRKIKNGLQMNTNLKVLEGCPSVTKEFRILKEEIDDILANNHRTVESISQSNNSSDIKGDAAPQPHQPETIPIDDEDLIFEMISSFYNSSSDLDRLYKEIVNIISQKQHLVHVKNKEGKALFKFTIDLHLDSQGDYQSFTKKLLLLYLQYGCTFFDLKDNRNKDDKLLVEKTFHIPSDNYTFHLAGNTKFLDMIKNRKNIEEIKSLIDNQIYINAQNSNGQGAVHLLINNIPEYIRGSSESINFHSDPENVRYVKDLLELLIKNGINLNMVDKNFQSIEQLLFSKGHYYPRSKIFQEIARLILTKRQKISPSYVRLVLQDLYDKYIGEFASTKSDYYNVITACSILCSLDMHKNISREDVWIFIAHLHSLKGQFSIRSADMFNRQFECFSIEKALSLRILSLTSLLMYIKKDNIGLKSLPSELIDGSIILDSDVLKKHRLLNLLIEEISITAETLRQSVENSLINLVGDHYILFDHLVDKYFNQISNFKEGDFLHFPTGYKYSHENKSFGHSFYFDISFIIENQIPRLYFRIDNLEDLGPITRKFEPLLNDLKYPIGSDPGKPLRVFPYLFTVDQSQFATNSALAKELLRNILMGPDMSCEVVLSNLYFHPNFKTIPTYKLITDVDLLKTLFPMRSIQSVANCVVKNWNFGCHIRLQLRKIVDGVITFSPFESKSHYFYRWFRKNEKNFIQTKYRHSQSQFPSNYTLGGYPMYNFENEFHSILHSASDNSNLIDNNNNNNHHQNYKNNNDNIATPKPNFLEEIKNLETDKIDPISLALLKRDFGHKYLTCLLKGQDIEEYFKNNQQNDENNFNPLHTAVVQYNFNENSSKYYYQIIKSMLQYDRLRNGRAPETNDTPLDLAYRLNKPTLLISLLSSCEFVSSESSIPIETEISKKYITEWRNWLLNSDLYEIDQIVSTSDNKELLQYLVNSFPFDYSDVELFHPHLKDKTFLESLISSEDNLLILAIKISADKMVIDHILNTYCYCDDNKAISKYLINLYSQETFSPFQLALQFADHYYTLSQNEDDSVIKENASQKYQYYNSILTLITKRFISPNSLPNNFPKENFDQSLLDILPILRVPPSKHSTFFTLFSGVENGFLDIAPTISIKNYYEKFAAISEETKFHESVDYLRNLSAYFQSNRSQLLLPRFENIRSTVEYLLDGTSPNDDEFENTKLYLSYLQEISSILQFGSSMVVPLVCANRRRAEEFYKELYDRYQLDNTKLYEKDIEIHSLHAENALLKAKIADLERRLGDNL